MIEINATEAVELIRLEAAEGDLSFFQPLRAGIEMPLFRRFLAKRA